MKPEAARWLEAVITWALGAAILIVTILLVLVALDTQPAHGASWKPHTWSWPTHPWCTQTDGSCWYELRRAYPQRSEYWVTIAQVNTDDARWRWHGPGNRIAVTIYERERASAYYWVVMCRSGYGCTSTPTLPERE